MAPAPIAAAAGGFTPGSPKAIAYLNQLLAKRGVDVQAADAVFGREGLSGGIGDSGHAFGPGQFNNAGGVWTGRHPGMSPQQENLVAWSPQGLAELAQRVAGVAGGLHGRAAIENIVTRFERPLHPGAEIAGALGAYGLPVAAGGYQGGSGGGGETSPLVGAAAGISPQQFAQGVTGLLSPTGEITDLGGLLQLLKQRRGTLNAALAPGPASILGPPSGGKAGQGQKGLPPVKAPRI